MINSKFVKSNPEVFGGTFCLNGTRIPIKSIIYLYKDLNISAEDISSKYYIQTKPEQIVGVIHWYEKNIKRYGQVAL